MHNQDQLEGTENRNCLEKKREFNEVTQDFYMIPNIRVFPQTMLAVCMVLIRRAHFEADQAQIKKPGSFWGKKVGGFFDLKPGGGHLKPIFFK